MDKGEAFAEGKDARGMEGGEVEAATATVPSKAGAAKDEEAREAIATPVAAPQEGSILAEMTEDGVAVEPPRVYQYLVGTNVGHC